MGKPLAAALLSAAALAAGCAEADPPRVLSVTVSADDPVSDADAADFLRLAAALGADRLAPLAAVRPEPGIDWPAGSTRTVADLAAATRDRAARRLTGPALTEALRSDRTAARWLDETGWSAGRFASIGAALGVAAVRNDLPDDRELKRLRAEAGRNLAALAADHRVFGSLDSSEAAAVRRRAAWAPRAVLLEALLDVPAENRTLARERADNLAAVLPAGFDRSALDRLLSDRERFAVPFTDPDPARDDARLRWDGREVRTGL